MVCIRRKCLPQFLMVSRDIRRNLLLVKNEQPRSVQRPKERANRSIKGQSLGGGRGRESQHCRRQTAKQQTQTAHSKPTLVTQAISKPYVLTSDARPIIRTPDPGPCSEGAQHIFTVVTSYTIPESRSGFCLARLSGGLRQASNIDAPSSTIKDRQLPPVIRGLLLAIRVGKGSIAIYGRFDEYVLAFLAVESWEEHPHGSALFPKERNQTQLRDRGEYLLRFLK